MKAFLLALAIVDDLGSMAVIAVVYTGDVEWLLLGLAALVVFLIALLQQIQVRAAPAYVALGVVLWSLLEGSGVSPTLAGVAVGLLIPAVAPHRPKAVSAEAHRIADETTDAPNPPDEDAPQWLRLAWLAREAVSPLARAERLLHPWTSYVVLPLFALANAGVSLAPSRLGPALSSRIAVGIIAARVIGKPIGIALASVLAVRLGLGRMPSGVRLRHLVGIGAAAGIPFAVSMYIARLELSPILVYRATVGILAAAVIAGLVGAAVIHRVTR